MVVSLLIGLPGERPGGLLLTVLYFLGSGLGALAVGFVYAAVGVTLPRLSVPLQASSAGLRGMPLLLLVFLLAHVPWLSPGSAGLLALLLYSFAYVGEILRSFLAAYPHALAEQARVIGLGPLGEWWHLRVPWTVWRAWAALLTHWVSLLKDTGALVVLGIGELTTVAKVFSELPGTSAQWGTVLLLAAALYLAATLMLIHLVPRAVGRVVKIMQCAERPTLRREERYA
jgi:ABC-type amino acid transport system permease subunit